MLKDTSSTRFPLPASGEGEDHGARTMKSSTSRRGFLGAAGVAGIALSVSLPAAEPKLGPKDADRDLPRVTVASVRRIFHNGEHNAFTDLCRFRGQLYLTFRS